MNQRTLQSEVPEESKNCCKKLILNHSQAYSESGFVFRSFDECPGLQNNTKISANSFLMWASLAAKAHAGLKRVLVTFALQK